MDINILTKEQLETAPQDSVISGLVYIRYFKRAVSKKGAAYLSGEIECKEKFSIIMWPKCAEFAIFEKLEVSNTLANITASIGEFGGKKSLTLTHLELLDNNQLGLNLDDFKCLKYDKNVYTNAFITLVKSHLSQKGMDLFESIFERNKVDGLWNKFSVEYASKLNHDNCESGLLAHTYKCLRLLDYLQKPYGFFHRLKTTEISENQDIIDLLYFGVILHDIGKVNEMKEGLYQPDSFNTHRIMGLEILFKHKDMIVSLYNEHWYQALVSILVGHHHEYGEKAKTVYAYIVYMIDNMEATFTGLDQLLTTNVMENIEGAKISWNEDILSL